MQAPASTGGCGARACRCCVPRPPDSRASTRRRFARSLRSRALRPVVGRPRSNPGRHIRLVLSLFEFYTCSPAHAVPNVRDTCGASNSESGDSANQLSDCFDLLAVDFGDDISALQAGAGGGTILAGQLTNNDTAAFRNPVQASNLRRQFLGNRSKESAPHLSVRHELIVDVNCGRGWQGKPNTVIQPVVVAICVLIPRPHRQIDQRPRSCRVDRRAV